MKRVLMGMALIMVVAAFCSFGLAAQNKGDPVTVSWYMQGGGQPADTDQVLAEVNKILGPKIGVNLKFNIIPFGDYNSKMQVKLAAGEDFDLCFTAILAFVFCSYVSKGLLLRRVDVLAKDGKDWVAKNRPKMSGWGKFADENSDQLMASQLYYGFENLLGVKVPSSIRISDKNLKVFNQFDSPEFEAYFKLMGKWSQKGYIKNDQMSIDDSTAVKQQNLVAIYPATRWGPSFEADGKTLSRPITQEGGQKVYRDPFPSNLAATGALPWQKVMDSWKVPGTARPYLTTGAIQGTMTGVNARTKHPVEVVKFFNLLYSDDPDGKKVLELLKFGIQGMHYDIDPKDSNRIIERPRLKDGWNYDVLWETGPGNIKGYTWKNENDVVKAAWRDLNSNAPASPVMGFTPDTSKLTNQIAAVNSVVHEYYLGLLLGAYPDVDKTLADFRAKLKKAGSDAIVAEVQRQVDAWKAANKK